MKPLEVDGVVYKSISEAHALLSPEGLSQFTVRWRLKNGWSPFLALTCPPVKPGDRRTFKEVRRTFGGLMK